jgi:hypothetical protein
MFFFVLEGEEYEVRIELSMRKSKDNSGGVMRVLFVIGEVVEITGSGDEGAQRAKPSGCETF